nr:UDP-glucuronosyltransferase 2C1-like [Leptinotarsa decemlineata]
MKELADKGHEVTFINSYPQQVPIENLKDISVEETIINASAYMANLTKFGEMDHWGQMEFMLGLGRTYTEVVLKNKNVQNLLNSDERFDLVVVEHLWNEAFVIFAQRFKCPLIYFSPGPTSIFNNHLFSNPSPSSYFPNLLTGYGSRMNFWERLRNTYLDILSEIFVEFKLIPEQNDLLKAAVSDAPDIRTILYNASLMFVMSDISIHDPLPLQPSIKSIGGHHVGPLKPLASNIQQFMDNATEGVIIFSMGSNPASSSFDLEKRTDILKVFSKIKQKVLWKFETDIFEKSSNIMITSWLPQQEVMAHPNTVAFISHGGLLGTIEAVYFGVPILGIPRFWDQHKNIEDAGRRNMAIKLNYHNINEQVFGSALNELLNNPMYRNSAKRQSRIMNDRPVKPLDEAVFWIEYVIRYRGAPHLRPAALDLKWYQRYLMDIVVFCSFIGITCLLFVFLASKCIYSDRKKIDSFSKKNK